MKQRIFLISFLCLALVSCLGKKKEAESFPVQPESQSAELSSDGRGSVEGGLEVLPLQTGGQKSSSVQSEGLFKEYKNDYLGFYAKIDKGDVTVRIDAEKFSKSGYCPEDDRPGSITKAVEGLGGECVGIFVGDIGQDINPVLCMLIADGSVEILSFFEAVKNYDYLSSGRMKGFDGIVSFRSGGGDPFEMDGKTAYSYVTVFGVDSGGAEKEVELFVGGEELYHFEKMEKGTVRYSISLSSDWKIHFTQRYVYSERYKQNLYGRFSGAVSLFGDDPVQLDYEFLSSYGLADNARSGDDVEVKSISQKGSLTLKEVAEADGFEVKQLSGSLNVGTAGEAAIIYSRQDEDPF